MWVIIIAIFSGLCCAGLLYLHNRKQHYGSTLTTILFLTRTIVVASLILLLFNPYLKSKNNDIEPATIIIAQDNSKSLILTKDSTFYKNDYPSVLDTLINNLDDKFNVDKYLFGNEVREFSSMDYQDYYTDFHQVLENIKKNYYKKNVGAVVLLSDGICNRSYLPEQNIESYPFPIFTVTLGDTTNHPDFYIRDVFYNKTSPSNTVFPIRLVANAHNSSNKNMEIKVKVNNEVVEEIVIPVNSNRFSQTIDFNIDSEDEGVKQIDIQIASIEGEMITNNNNKTLYCLSTTSIKKRLLLLLVIISPSIEAI